VAILLDNPQRDLPATVLTAFELCQRGAVCHIVPATLREPELWALAPDAVLLFHFRRGWAPLAARLSEARIAYGVLDNEGGIWPDLSDYARPLCDDPALRARVSPLCVWGERIRSFLAGETIFKPEQIVVTGGPRFDFYNPRWRGIAQEGHAVGAAERRSPRLLVVTNYSEVNPRFSDVEEVRRHLQEVFSLTAAQIEELLNWQTEALTQTIGLVRSLARDNPEAEIAVRPHPFEGTTVYAEQLDGLPNVSISTTASIGEDVLASRAVIQRYSTTAIDAAFAGVPSLVPLWIPAPSYPVIESVSAACRDYSQLREEVAAILGGGHGIPEARSREIASVLRDWFGEPDGEAHRRCAEAVAVRLPRERVVSEEACDRFLQFLHNPTRPWTRAGRRLRQLLRLSPRFSFRGMREEPPREWIASDQFFDVSAVTHLVRRVLAAKHRAGERVHGVRVTPAREDGTYRLRFGGQSVTMRREAA
jgi:surface carbohydrate biosynthesis protein